MDINNLDYVIISEADSGRLYAAGSANTFANTFAGPGAGLADAGGYAVGQDTSVMAVAYALAQKSQRTQNAYGSAAAYAYGASARRIENSYAVSSSRYRSTSYLGHITAAGSFSSHS